MKNIITTILVLFVLVVNAQQDTTMTISTWLSTGESDTVRIITKYDTTIIYGLGMYIYNYSNEWDTGTDFELEPVKKLTIQKLEVLSNNILWAYGSPVYEVYLKRPVEKGKCLDCPLIYNWVLLDRDHTEIIFIKKP